MSELIVSLWSDQKIRQFVKIRGGARAPVPHSWHLKGRAGWMIILECNLYGKKDAF